jgi:hypothetical protein
MVPERLRMGVVVTVLCGLVVSAGLLHLRVRNPDAGVLERMNEVAKTLPPRGTLAFVSGAPPRQARYAYHALRYTIAPRPLRSIDAEPRADWLVVQGRRQVEGYEQTRSLGADLGLWKRQ